MNEPMLSKPKNIIERILRKVGLLKRIKINNYSNCDVRIINDILVKKGESEKIYMTGTKYIITLCVFIDNNWNLLYKNRQFDTKFDLNIYDRDVDLARRNKVVFF